MTGVLGADQEAMDCRIAQELIEVGDEPRTELGRVALTTRGYVIPDGIGDAAVGPFLEILEEAFGVDMGGREQSDVDGHGGVRFRLWRRWR